jgi:Coenzyme PQQ synthesis protein D (PqqD)
MRTVSQQSNISISTIIMAGKDPVASEMANEVAILDPKSGMYFGLDHVGARIWELIQEPKSVKDIRDTILEEYDVEVDRCELDLFGLFRVMSVNGLIEVRD